MTQRFTDGTTEGREEVIAQDRSGGWGRPRRSPPPSCGCARMRLRSFLGTRWLSMAARPLSLDKPATAPAISVVALPDGRRRRHSIVPCRCSLSMRSVGGWRFPGGRTWVCGRFRWSASSGPSIAALTSAATFRPRRRLSASRLASLRTAFPDGVIPAITVFEVGGAYFVEDGHHRVALARERGADYIDAEITRLETSYEVGRDVDVAQLIHTEQQRKLLDESGLRRARPEAVIEFTFVDGYAQLAEVIKAHDYDLARRAGSFRRPRGSRRPGTTRSTGRDAMPCAAPACPSSTPPGPTDADLFYGSTSSVATCARATPQSTSTWRPRTRVRSGATNAPGASFAAERADRFRNAAAEKQGAVAGGTNPAKISRDHKRPLERAPVSPGRS